MRAMYQFRDNWYALIISIINKTSVNESLNAMGVKVEQEIPNRKHRIWTEEEREDIIRQREAGRMYNEISECYGVSVSQIQRVYRDEVKKRGIPWVDGRRMKYERMKKRGELKEQRRSP